MRSTVKIAVLCFLLPACFSGQFAINQNQQQPRLITADELIHDCLYNQTEAQTYEGKRLRVRGEAQGISLKDKTMSFGQGQGIGDVGMIGYSFTCIMSDNRQLEPVLEKQTIIVEGIMTSAQTQDHLDLRLTNCKVVKLLNRSDR